MNKKTVLRLSLVLLTYFTTSAQRFYTSEGDFLVESMDGGISAEITAYVGSNQIVRIPRQIQEMYITGIGESAFHEKDVIRVTIPRGVSFIGDRAFALCTNLAGVTIPNSVTSIGDMAFWGCKNLARVTIPNSVISIGDGAFRYNTSLASVTMGNNVTSIGDMAFWGCENLTSVTIGNSVTSIGVGAFGGCTSLASIIIPASVISIETGAFVVCESLASVTFGRSNTNIANAFLGDLADKYASGGAGTYITANQGWDAVWTKQ